MFTTLSRSWRTWLPIAASGVLFATVMAILAVTLTPATPHPSVTLTAATDPGVALYEVLHADGATMPPSWSALADASRPQICATPASIRYSQFPASYHDEFGVTPAMARAAIVTSGFCAAG